MKNNNSSLPHEIRHKIWLLYASHDLSYSYLIEKNLIELFDIKFTKEINSCVELSSIGKLTIDEDFLAQQLFKEACHRKNFDIMEYFYDKYDKKIFRAITCTCSYDYDFWFILFLTDVDHAFLVLKWFHKKQFRFDSTTSGLYGFAIRANRLDIVQWLYENLKTLSAPTVNEVFDPLFEKDKSEFNAEIVYYFFDKFPQFMTDFEIENLLLRNPFLFSKDNVAALKVLYDILQRPELTIYKVDPVSWSNIMSCACFHRAYECMEWINNNKELKNFILSLEVVEYACKKSDLKLLEWLIQNRKEFQDGRVKIPNNFFGVVCS